MKVKILKSVKYEGRWFYPGEVVDIKISVAKRLEALVAVKKIVPPKSENKKKEKEDNK